MNEKMTKAATVLFKILTVVKKLLGAAAIVVLVCGIILPFAKDKMISDSSTVSFGELEMELANPISSSHATNEVYLIEFELIAMLAVVIVTRFFAATLCDILAPMKDGTPFEKGISNKVKKIGHFTLAIGILSQVLELAFSATAFIVYDIYSLVDQTKVLSCNYNYSFDIKFIFVAFIIYLLSYVFKYGEELQREADETL